GRTGLCGWGGDSEAAPGYGRAKGRFGVARAGGGGAGMRVGLANSSAGGVAVSRHGGGSGEQRPGDYFGSGAGVRFIGVERSGGCSVREAQAIGKKQDEGAAGVSKTEAAAGASAGSIHERGILHGDES